MNKTCDLGNLRFAIANLMTFGDMLLMTTGCLKPVETWKDEDRVDWAKLLIPNMEVRTAYRREIWEYIVSSQGVESNREPGYGRFDIAFFPQKENAPGIILELKAAKSEDELETRAKEALAQIEEKAYGTEMTRQGVKEIWRYGIAFCGKRVWMTGK